MTTNTGKFLLLGLTTFGMVMNSLASDWPSWRGPEANSISTESIKGEGSIEWKKELGAGYSAVTVKDGKLLSAGNIENKDYIYCLDAKTGKEVWTYSQDSDKGKSYAGPLGTPITDGTNVYLFNRHGDLLCVDFATGKKLWETALLKDAKMLPQWCISSSPVVYQDLVIVSVGASCAAVNKSTGKVAWQSDGLATYSTPTLMNYKGKDYFINISGDFISAIEPLTGKVAAQIDLWEPTFKIIGASPVIIDAEKGLFIATSGYKAGRCVLYSFDGSSIKEQWTVKHLNSQFSTPVYQDGVIYGSHGNTNGRKALSAIDAKTGELLWQGTCRFGSPLIAGDKLVYLDERGELFFLNIDKTKESIISSLPVLKGGKSWQMPVIANGYIYCRNSLGSLVCVKVAAK